MSIDSQVRSVPPARGFFALVASDAQRHFETWVNRSGFGAVIRLTLLTPGFQLAVAIRLQRSIVRVPLVGIVLRRILWYWTSIRFACDIDPDATFGSGLYIPHPTGIVIGGEWDIGDGSTILQGVTLGRTTTPNSRSTIGDGVRINAGAKIIGCLHIGDRAVVGANAVVLRSLPDGAVAVGVPARIVRVEEER